jgi:Cu(I)/Ag(I) efflux system membrane fusion protein
MNKLNVLLLLGAGLLLGSFMTAGLLSSQQDGELDTPSEADQKPLYWVAPMDPDFRRDGPGKSPMGMDLVPVYADGDGGDPVGTVRISPDVVNNLGVRIADVNLGVFEPLIRTVGHVTFDEDQLVHIHPRVEGWIETLHVKAEGDPVAAEEPIFDLYSPTLVNAQEELLLALNRNNPDLVDAALQRLTALKVPDSTISDVRRQRRVSQTVTIYAPRSGVVQSLAVREGMYISPGMNVMTIGPLDHVWVVGELYERQAQLVHEGDAVALSLDYLPGRSWTGRVDYVYPSLNEQTRTVRVRTQFGNEDRALKPGMFGALSIRAIRDAQPTLLIPREALIRTGNQNRVVLALGEGRFKSIAVRPGRIGPRQAEILEGLTAGDRIVVSAQFLIDSESSRTSDFLRMSHDDSSHLRSSPEVMDRSDSEGERNARTESRP